MRLYSLLGMYATAGYLHDSVMIVQRDTVYIVVCVYNVNMRNYASKYYLYNQLRHFNNLNH